MESDVSPDNFYGFPTIYGDAELAPDLAYPKKTKVKGETVYKPDFPFEWAQSLQQQLPLRPFKL